jgi:hypothetical protein
MTDPTEAARRKLIAEQPERLADGLPSPNWSTEEMTRDFEVVGFMAPFVVVRRRSDGVKGSLEFRHQPRIYFNFQADS